MEIDQIIGQKKYNHAIIIVMFDRIYYLENHLRMLSPDKYDIILVLGYLVNLDEIKNEIQKYKHNIIIIKRKNDDGPAGGFYIGYKYAIDNKYEYITFAEDDCYPIEPDLPYKIRMAKKVVVPNTLHSVNIQDYGMWRYATLSSDVTLQICPELYFYYEDSYALSSIDPKNIVFLSDTYVYHDFMKKFHKQSPFSINKYLSNRNLLIYRNKWLSLSNLKSTFLYMISLYFDLLFSYFYDRKNLKYDLLGIVDGLFMNLDRTKKDPSLIKLKNLNQHLSATELPKDIFDVTNIDLKQSRLKNLHKILLSKNILIDSSEFGLQTYIYRIFVNRIYMKVEDKYYMIAESNIPKYISVPYFIISILLALMTIPILILSHLVFNKNFKCGSKIH